MSDGMSDETGMLPRKTVSETFVAAVDNLAVLLLLLLPVVVLVRGVSGEDTHRVDVSVEGGLAPPYAERRRVFRLESDDPP